MPSAFSRRRALGLAGLGVLAATAGCSDGTLPGSDGGTSRPARATCVPRSSLDAHRSLAGLPLRYEVDGRRATFWFDGAFFGRLESWAGTLGDVLPAEPVEVATYGSWTDGGSSCDSWHDAGRAFDLARLRLADDSVVSCRYDRWRSEEGSRLEDARRRYWALAAGLHQRFAYVLTYLYDDRHANHLHVDNGRSGDADSTFSSRSRVQVQAVQALCRYLWAEPVELSGRWDTATRRAAGRVLDGLGLADDLARPASWQGFLAASAARGRD